LPARSLPSLAFFLASEAALDAAVTAAILASLASSSAFATASLAFLAYPFAWLSASAASPADAGTVLACFEASNDGL